MESSSYRVFPNGGTVVVTQFEDFNELYLNRKKG